MPDLLNLQFFFFTNTCPSPPSLPCSYYYRRHYKKAQNFEACRFRREGGNKTVKSRNNPPVYWFSCLKIFLSPSLNFHVSFPGNIMPSLGLLRVKFLTWTKGSINRFQGICELALGKKIIFIFTDLWFPL